MRSAQHLGELGARAPVGRWRARSTPGDAAMRSHQHGTLGADAEGLRRATVGVDELRPDVQRVERHVIGCENLAALATRASREASREAARVMAGGD